MSSINRNRQLESIIKEINTLESKSTQDIVEYPKNIKPFKTQQIYKIKDPNSKEPIYKSRVISKGFEQI